MTDVLQFDIDEDEHEQYYANYVLEDAENAGDWPNDDLHVVTLDPRILTIEGTPEGIRWLYDYMERAEDAYKLEDGREYARGCRVVADAAWDALGEDPPDQQRPRKMLR